MLLVPIHLDALTLDDDAPALEAMAHFSRLPYFDGITKINDDVANISEEEEIVPPPFQNLNLTLKAGIHLHWSLPDALTRARHTPRGQEFPPVPNRWLITRCRKNGDVEKEWIVESDYLYPVKTPDGFPQEIEDLFGTPVTVPYHRDDPQPFRYLGRSAELEEWLKETSTAEYYPKLTAVGYGGGNREGLRKARAGWTTERWLVRDSDSGWGTKGPSR